MKLAYYYYLHKPTNEEEYSCGIHSTELHRRWGTYWDKFTKVTVISNDGKPCTLCHPELKEDKTPWKEFNLVIKEQKRK